MRLCISDAGATVGRTSKSVRTTAGRTWKSVLQASSAEANLSLTGQSDKPRVRLREPSVRDSILLQQQRSIGRIPALAINLTNPIRMSREVSTDLQANPVNAYFIGMA